MHSYVNDYDLQDSKQTIMNGDSGGEEGGGDSTDKTTREGETN